MKTESQKLTRRAFLDNLGKLAIAHTTVYVVGLAFEEIGGNFAAGAKCAPPMPAPPCNLPGRRWCCPGPPDYWACTPVNSC